jgi:enoyl-CoA hydratase
MSCPPAKRSPKRIATKGPVAVSKIIETVNAYFDKGTDGFEREVNEFGATRSTGDFREGVAAFIEKRKANFEGK